MQRPRRTSYRRTLKNIASAAKNAYGHFDRAATAIGRWIVTDHTGFSQAMSDMPKMGFKDTCYYIIVELLIMVAGVLLHGVLIFVMIAFGIPALLSVLFS
jgi:hypothetical protein